MRAQKRRQDSSHLIVTGIDTQTRCNSPILGRLRTQNLGLAAHNTKQLLYHHPYLGGPIEEYLKHFLVTNEQLARIGKALPDSDVAHWMLENLPEEDSSWRSVVSSFYTMPPDPDVITSFQASVAIRNHYNQLTAPPIATMRISTLAPPVPSRQSSSIKLPNQSLLTATHIERFGSQHGRPMRPFVLMLQFCVHSSRSPIHYNRGR